MHIKDIREELQSYGVDCSSIFEKKELIDALVKARRENWIRSEFEVDDYKYNTAADDGYTATEFRDAFTTEAEAEDTSNNEKGWFKQGLEDMADKFSTTLKDKVRNERIKLEMSRLQDMKVKELKAELESYGISTKSFFEKSEFVKAVAEARIDGVKKKKTVGSTTTTNKGWRDEAWDPSYKDVSVRRFDSSFMDPTGVIDVRLR